MASAKDSGEQYSIENEERWVGAVRRKYGGASDFVKRFEHALSVLRRDPHGRQDPHIVPLRKPLKGKYRYRHGRCRVIYLIAEERKLVRLLRVEPRDETTYARDLR